MPEPQMLVERVRNRRASPTATLWYGLTASHRPPTWPAMFVTHDDIARFTSKYHKGCHQDETVLSVSAIQLTLLLCLHPRL